MAIRLGNVTLRQLRALAALAAGGSVTAAARILNLTQPAVTLQLRGLQQLAEIPLLQRTSEGMLLTDAGREILTLVGRIDTAIADCEASLEVLSGRTGGRVSIGAVSTAKYFIPSVIAAFSRDHPKIKVVLSIGNRTEIIEALRSYQLDIAVMGRPPPDVEVERHLIGDHPHVIVAPAGHWLAREEGLNVIDLTHEVFLTREQGSGTRILMERLFDSIDITPTIGMEFTSNESIKQGVMAGLGIAFISAHAVAHEVNDGRLVMLDVATLPITRQWFVIRRSDKVMLPAAQSAYAFLASETARFLPRFDKPAGRG